MNENIFSWTFSHRFEFVMCIYLRFHHSHWRNAMKHYFFPIKSHQLDFKLIKERINSFRNLFFTFVYPWWKAKLWTNAHHMHDTMMLWKIFNFQNSLIFSFINFFEQIFISFPLEWQYFSFKTDNKRTFLAFIIDLKCKILSF